MKNRELKKKLVNDETYANFCNEVWLNRLKGIYDDDASMYGLTEQEFEACNQLRDAKCKCWSRIYQHIKYLGMKYGFNKLIFATLTFNDYALSLSADTRKQKVRRLLQANCDDYIANIDYGKKGEREHYHAVIVPKVHKMPSYEVINGKPRLIADWLTEYSKYGFYSLEALKTSENDVSKVGRYIAKLSNHSIKVKQTMIMTKKNSDYQRWLDMSEKGRYHPPIENTRDAEQYTYDRLVELFGKDGIIVH